MQGSIVQLIAWVLDLFTYTLKFPSASVKPVTHQGSKLDVTLLFNLVLLEKDFNNIKFKLKNISNEIGIMN